MPDARPSARRLARSTVGLVLAVALVATMGWGAASSGRQTAPPGSEDRLDVRNPHVVVLKSKRKLHLFDGQRLVRTYDIALGPHAIGQKFRQADGRTPEGRFRVRTRNDRSKYCRFLGIDYPDPAAAQRGLRDGLISYGEFKEIIEAHATGRCPLWTSALGGGIGIHGHGTDGDWTAGCVALADEDVKELYRVLRLGDVVEILP